MSASSQAILDQLNNNPGLAVRDAINSGDANALRTALNPALSAGFERIAPLADRQFSEPAERLGRQVKVWRSPLEYAITSGASPEMVSVLLEAGAHVQPSSVRAVCARLENAPASARTANIITQLSAAGADWSEKVPDGSDHVRAVDFISQLVGPNKIQDLGVQVLSPVKSSGPKA